MVVGVGLPEDQLQGKEVEGAGVLLRGLVVVGVGEVGLHPWQVGVEGEEVRQLLQVLSHFHLRLHHQLVYLQAKRKITLNQKHFHILY